jgi:hypothetical protein
LRKKPRWTGRSRYGLLGKCHIYQKVLLSAKGLMVWSQFFYQFSAGKCVLWSKIIVFDQFVA